MRKFHPNTIILISAIVGAALGFTHQPALIFFADGVVECFMRLLKLISTPLIFIAILSTLTGMGSLQNARKMGGRLIKYTLLTTVIAATIALILYLIIDPARQMMSVDMQAAVPEASKASYLSHLATLVPSNMLQPFLEGNPISVLFVALLIGIAVLMLPEEKQQKTHKSFSVAFMIIMNVMRIILKILPVVIFSFFLQFTSKMLGKDQIGGLLLFLSCVLSANVIQAFVVLPTLLRIKGLSPLHIFRSMRPAIVLAFISKSSGASLPLTIDNAEKNLGMQPRVSRFIFPLCITINMNACAAFILITTLFVSMSSGVHFSNWELIGWIAVSTIAAIGNAGVPMGCFMLSSAILASMNVPLQLMGIILPFYALIDMLESGINVWSDACITTIVAKESDALELPG